LNKWRSKPQSYLKEVLGVGAIWKLQDQLLSALPRAIEEGKPIYIGSGHSLGKDYICAAISLWFLHCFSPSNVIQTAPTDRQVKKIMWGETLGHWHKRKIDLGGRAYATPYLEIRKHDWYLIGFTTKDTGASRTAEGGKFQGFHSPNVCVIVSEAQAVEDSIFDQIDGITTSENNLIIFIGNPTTAKGRFAKGLRDHNHNIVFNFSCLENPNYKHKRTLIPGLASYKWVEDKRRKWGEDDPRWYGRVLGQIPDVAVNHVLGPADIRQMMSRFGFLAQHSINSGVAVDPAGEGVDDNVLMAGKGGEIIEVYTKTSMAPSVTAHKAVEMCKAHEGNFIIVDCDGVGIAVFQELEKLNKAFLGDIQLIKFHGSARLKTEDEDNENYYNQRTEAAFVTQRRARAGRAALDERDTELIEDLQEDLYFEKNGFIHLIDKEDIKESLGRSPGRGDAYKMLQWAFEQKFKVIDTSGERQYPRYAESGYTPIVHPIGSTSRPRTYETGVVL